MSKYWVDISGGLASATCLFRTIDRYGKENVSARFADTRTESSDTYEFIDRVIDVAGVDLVKLDQGKDIWDVFMDRKMMTQPSRGCLASYWLKKIPLNEHAKRFPDSTFMIGFGPDECDRVERIQTNNPTIKFDFPLRWEPKGWYCDVKRELNEAGITQFPIAYREGMGHNNCNRRCIQGGIGYWSLKWKDYPNEYAIDEKKEQEFLQMLRDEGRNEHTILKDRRGGKPKNFSLKQLRIELENGIRFPDEQQRIKCACDMAQQLVMFDEMK